MAANTIKLNHIHFRKTCKANEHVSFDIEVTNTANSPIEVKTAVSCSCSTTDKVFTISPLETTTKIITVKTGNNWKGTIVKHVSFISTNTVKAVLTIDIDE